jgi:hypothetical protein
MKIYKSSVSAIDINKRIAAYSVGAGAAMLAASGAEAGIIWSGPLSDDFGDSSGTWGWTIEGSQSEINLLGNADSFLSFFGATGADQQMEFINSFGDITLLQTGDVVNNAANFLSNAEFYYKFESVYYIGTTSYVSSTVRGDWTTDGQKGFFGFRFKLENESASGSPAGSFVYGWGEVERITSADGRLLQWAYDDSGDPITVGAIPEPGTLGLLALGAVGIVALRKQRGGVE